MSNSPESNLKQGGISMPPETTVGTPFGTAEHGHADHAHAEQDRAEHAQTGVNAAGMITRSPVQSSAAELAADLMQGTVKWFNDAKGFGFIEHSSGRDVFVHYSVIETEGFKTLKDGEVVLYSLAEGNKGLHAARVVRDPSAVKSTPPKSAKTTVSPEAPGEGALASKMEIERTGTPSADSNAPENVETEEEDTFSARSS